MSVTAAEVAAVAALARLRLKPGEVERLTAELNDIIAHVAELAAVDVSGVEAATVAAEGSAPLRPDSVVPNASRIDLAAIAPRWEDGFFVVPRLPALDRDPDDSP